MDWNWTCISLINMAAIVCSAALMVALSASDGDAVLQSFYSAPAQDNLVGASAATLAYAAAQHYVSDLC